MILVLLFSTSTMASNQYFVTYGDITLGEIEDINTINDGYLIAQPNSFVSFILGFDKYVIYESQNKPKVSGDIEYKEDNLLVLDIIRKLSKKRLKKQYFEKNNQSINIICKNDICTYKRKIITSKNTYTGKIIFKKNKFISICDDEDGICIKQ
jgi:hypothetical protein